MPERGHALAEALDAPKSTRRADQCLISANNLNLAFGGNKVLRDVNLELFAGDVILLRGENGSGKTTLLNVLTGNLDPDRGAISLFAGDHPVHFRFPQLFWQRLNPLSRFSPETIARSGVGRSWQDIRLFNSLTVVDNLKVAANRGYGESLIAPILFPNRIRKHDLIQEQDSARILSRFALNRLRDISAMDLSLGDAKRTAIARSIQAQAKVLFLDEPLSGLDDNASTVVVDLLRTLVASHKMTLVLIEHSFNIPRLLDLVTRVWTMRSGELIEQDPDQIRCENHTSTRDGIAAWTDRLANQGWAKNVTALSSDASLTTISAPGRINQTEVIQVRNWTVRRGSQQVIGPSGATRMDVGLTFTLKAGQIGILRAPNGWGKTSLAESITGLLPADSGQLTFLGEEIQTQPSWERSKRGMGFLQSRENVFPSLKTKEMISLCRSNGQCDLATTFRNRRIENLSGGERQRVASCRYPCP